MPDLDLLFLESTDPKKPHAPIAHIYVATHSRGSYKGHEDKILLCSECLTLREIKEAIDRLKRDLDAIGKKAKTKLKR